MVSISSSETARQAACTMLEQWGIDCTLVAQDGITSEGYYLFDLTPDGKRWLRGDEQAKHFEPWPEGFPVEYLFTLLHRMNGAHI